MKTTAEKSSSSTAASIHAMNSPFFGKGGGGDFFGGQVQAKLTVNKPGDKFEKEADTMADKVVKMPSPQMKKEEKLQRLPEEKIQKKEPELEKSKIQKKDAVKDRLQKAEPEKDKVQKKEPELEKSKIQKAEPEKDKVQKAEPEKDKVQKKEPELENSKIQKKESSGTPAVASATQTSIQNQTTGGQPLSPDVKGYMEPRFGADFSNVRVHSDEESARLNNQISARAFTYQNHVFFSRDQYQPGTSEGKQLLAHELTHTIQQGHAQQTTAPITTTTTPPPVQRLGISDALDYFADAAYNIPGYRMLTIIIGFNPINMSSTDRSAANILRALVEFMPGGHLITQALDNHGVFNKAGAWVESQLSALGDIGASIISGLESFLDSLSWTDIFDLGGVWERAKRIFTGPVDQLISFAAGLVSAIMDMVKEAILRPLAAMAEGTAGYDLLRAVLGFDPITGDAYPQNADTLIGGFMKLIGREDIWDNIKKGNAVERAYAWFQGALSGLMGLVTSIPGRIVDTINSITWEDVITIVGVFTKVGKAFISLVSDFTSWAFNQVLGLLEIIFSVVAPNAMPYLKKAAGAFNSILENPVGFVGNLVQAGKQGFQMFAGNIVNHLKTALIKWITGPLGEAGVYIPKSFSILEILKLVMSVLGLTWQNIRSKLVKIIPEPVLVVLEKTASILVTLVKDGPAAAWEQIKAELEEMKGALIAQVTQMVTTEIVKAAIFKLVSMLNPAGAVIQAIIAIYNTITFFIEKINQIGAVVGAFIDSISAIASGSIGAAAAKVEQTMANTLVVVIGFLAKFAGLGGIPNKLVGIVNKIRKPIDKGLDRIVAWLGAILKKLGAKISGLLFPAKSFAVGRESHRVYEQDGEVMMASTPGRLAGALDGLAEKAKGHPKEADIKKQITNAKSKGTALSNKIKKAKAAGDKSQEQIKAELVAGRDDIVAIIMNIYTMLEGAATKDKMDNVTVNFTVKGDANEFKRQIAMQAAALNAMQIVAWKTNRARFLAFGRDARKEDTDTKRLDQQIVAVKASVVPSSPTDNAPVSMYGVLAADLTKLNTYKQARKPVPHAEAETIAKASLANSQTKGQAVLHQADQVAGGSATAYGDKEGVLGSAEVNSAIGNQWKTNIGLVDKGTEKVKGDANLNVSLKA